MKMNATGSVLEADCRIDRSGPDLPTHRAPTTAAENDGSPRPAVGRGYGSIPAASSITPGHLHFPLPITSLSAEHSTATGRTHVMPGARFDKELSSVGPARGAQLHEVGRMTGDVEQPILVSVVDCNQQCNGLLFDASATVFDVYVDTGDRSCRAVVLVGTNHAHGVPVTSQRRQIDLSVGNRQSHLTRPIDVEEPGDRNPHRTCEPYQGCAPERLRRHFRLPQPARHRTVTV